MHALKIRWSTVALLGAGVVAFSAAAATAGPWSRDAGSKMRGDFQSPARSSQPAPMMYRAPAAAQVVQAPSERRVFTYGPNPFNVGDKVVVTAEGTRLMLGTRSVADVPKGTALKVLATEGPWVGTRVEHDGKQTGGWILMDRLEAAAQGADASPPAKRTR